MLFFLFFVPLVWSITVDANVLDVQQFKAPQFATMTDAVENITHYLGILTQNITTLTGYVGELTSQLDIGPLMQDLANITGNLETTLSNMTGDVDAILNIVTTELDILNEKVIDDFLMDSFQTFSGHLNSNFSTLNTAITSFFDELNIEVLLGQVVNTCILGAFLLFMWVYFSRFWPRDVEDLTVDKIIRGFGAPAIPLLVGCVLLEIIWIPFLLIEWQNLQGMFVKNLVVVIPMIVFAFLLLQFILVLTYCMYLRIWQPLSKTITNGIKDRHQLQRDANQEENQDLDENNLRVNSKNLDVLDVSGDRDEYKRAGDEPDELSGLLQ